MVPDRIEAWLNGGPWGRSSDYFWERVRARNLEPFTLYSSGWGLDRTTHEFGHLIQLKNPEHILCPYWGVPEFAPGLHDRISLQAGLTECEVMVIDMMIRNHLNRRGNYFPPLDDWSIVENQIMLSLPPNGTDDTNIAAFWHKEVKRHRQSWDTIEKVWEELQRKYAILAEVLR